MAQRWYAMAEECWGPDSDMLQLLRAAERGDAATIRALLPPLSREIVRGHQGMTPLHLASKAGHMDAAQVRPTELQYLHEVCN